ncbi:CPBP family intramembrane glutamic endopeptidase [Pedobacter sp. Hv1]|uniref:CPBP family intramembrane glutamic endopeptidase n=1 Tax=Pedobacter sp. Hv1 TaxID=1740090 RepID=UPI0006D88EA5|nr:CPBP family intramembrane glutamic endopeptidase [Pedobacter sp. Hv1]KQB99158.1 peptidase [Pedobacter sp. Hv1]
MQTIQTAKQENSPFIQLLLLGIYALVGLIVFALIAFALIFLVYGFDAVQSLVGVNPNLKMHVEAMKILLTAQQIGLFLTPTLLLAITEGKKPQRFYGMAMPKTQVLVLILLIMTCSMPIMGWVNELNQKMVLPDFLKSLQEWMRKLEDEGEKTTLAILKMNSIGGYLINLLVIAIVPAICEELIFRGALQRVFLRWIKNPHVAIWTSAFIFSTIHFQFFGFFPRLLLGAGFGYFYFWTGSIWYTIFAHFLNNGFAVTMAWYFQKNNLPINQDEGMTVAWYGYVISAILTIALLKFLKDSAKIPNGFAPNTKSQIKE